MYEFLYYIIKKINLFQMNIRKSRINFGFIFIKIFFIFVSLICKSNTFRQIAVDNNLQPDLEICEEIKNFEKENFSIFDELSRNSVDKDISILITNKGNF